MSWRYYLIVNFHDRHLDGEENELQRQCLYTTWVFVAISVRSLDTKSIRSDCVVPSLHRICVGVLLLVFECWYSSLEQIRETSWVIIDQTNTYTVKYLEKSNMPTPMNNSKRLFWFNIISFSTILTLKRSSPSAFVGVLRLDSISPNVLLVSSLLYLCSSVGVWVFKVEYSRGFVANE